MAVAIRIDVDERAVRRALLRLMHLDGALRRVLQRSGLFIRRAAVRRLRERRGRFGASSGRLAQSLAIRTEPTSVAVGSNLAYAAIQQLGGTVVPRTVRALAIPMLRHLARRGVWPRDLPRDSMRFVPLHAGNVVGKLVRAEDRVIETRGGKRRRRVAGKAGETMYLLVRQSRIRGRPYLVFGAEERQFLLAETQREVERTARG